MGCRSASPNGGSSEVYLQHPSAYEAFPPRLGRRPAADRSPPLASKHNMHPDSNITDSRVGSMNDAFALTS